MLDEELGSIAKESISAFSIPGLNCEEYMSTQQTASRVPGCGSRLIECSEWEGICKGVRVLIIMLG